MLTTQTIGNFEDSLDEICKTGYYGWECCVSLTKCVWYSILHSSNPKIFSGKHWQNTIAPKTESSVSKYSKLKYYELEVLRYTWCIFNSLGAD